MDPGAYKVTPKSAGPEEIRAEGLDEAREDDEVTEADGGDDPTQVSDDCCEQQVAAAETGVTREPGNEQAAGRGKLRPKGAADDQS